MSKESFYQSLTRLFRSGPQIKRKIKGHDERLSYDARIAQANLGYYSPNSFRRDQSPFSVMGSFGVLDRMSRYATFAEMEYRAEVATALDVYGDEATTPDETGKCFHIYSNNPRVQKVLEQLFYETCNIEYDARRWARNLVKYGDFFLYLEVAEGEGVTSIEPMPVNEVERIEGYDPADRYAVKFAVQQVRSKFLENWQVIHFRNVSNELFLPYGTCHEATTKILTNSGIKEIQHITTDDIVLSFDLKTQTKRESRVLGVKNSGFKPCLEIKTKYANLTTSKEHWILTVNSNEGFEYKPAGRLEVGDKFIIDNEQNLNGNFPNEKFLVEPIISITPTMEEKETYDIYVENENHNFYANNIVTHNSFLDAAMRPWRVLNMMEDAMLVYRIVRCLHGDSNVWTSNGYKKIKDIKVGEQVFSFDYNKNELVPSIVTDWVNNGNQQIWKIRSTHRTLKTNFNHPVLVKNNKTGIIDYVSTCDLIPKIHQLVKPSKISGHIPTEISLNEENYEWYGFLQNGYQIKGNKSEQIRLISEKLQYSSGRIKQFIYAKNKIKGIPYKIAVEVCNEFNIPLDKLKKYPKGMFNLDRINLPNYVNEEFAKFFGFMLGDGYITKNLHEIGFSTGVDPENNKFYFDILKKYSNDAKFYQESRNTNQELGKVKVSSFYLTHLMKDMGYILGAHNKRVPGWVFTSSDEIKEAFIDGLIDADGHRRKQANTDSITLELCNKALVEDIKELCHQLGWNVSSSVATRNKSARSMSNGNKVKATTSYSLYFTKIKSELYENILEVGPTDEYSDVYDIRVDNNLHNFIADGCVVHNSPERRVFYIDVSAVSANDIPTYMEGVKQEFMGNGLVDRMNGKEDFRYEPVSVLKDYFLPIRPNNLSKIETLQGGQHVSAVEDVEYIQKQLIAALKVPKPYLTFDEAVSSKSTLAQIDIRFSRLITGIQKILIAELNKLAIIHLYSKGFSGNDLTDFDLRFSNPSSVALQQRLSLWTTKFDTAAKAKETLLVDSAWIQKELLGLQPDEIDRIREGLEADAVLNKKIENMEIPQEFANGVLDQFDGTNYDIPASPNLVQYNDEQQKAINNDPKTKMLSYPGIEKAIVDGNKGNQTPLKANPNVSKTNDDRSRRVTFTGSRALSMPNFAKANSANDKYISDPFDKNTLMEEYKRNNPTALVGFSPLLDSGTVRMLKKMDEALGITARQIETLEILSEGSENHKDGNTVIDLKQLEAELLE